MSGAFNAGGLITGLDTNNIIRQLMQLERRPITRLQQRVTGLEGERNAIRDFRTQLLALRNRAQDFRFNNTFRQFTAASSAVAVLTAEVTGTNPVAGAYAVNVTQLASATAANSSAKLGASINPGAALNSSGINGEISSGTFSINGVQFTVDTATDTLNSVLAAINGSAAGVTASYNPTTDKVTLENTAPGNTSLINFGATGDTSNLLDRLNLRQATQTTGGSGSTTVTSTRNLGAVDATAALNTVNFAGGAIAAGSFQINGITITVDPTADNLSDVLSRINDSDAQVTASYDSSTDTIRVVSDTLGSRTIAFTAGTSNFLNVTNLTTATQTAGNDSQFTINGGAAQTRNTNKVSDAIGGVTLNLLSEGASTVTVSANDDKIIEDVKKFIEEFNRTLTQINTLAGRGGRLERDGTVRSIENALKSTIFAQVTGITGGFTSLVDVGFSTGGTFDSEATTQISLNEQKFREALGTNRLNLEGLFTNSSKTGIADQLFNSLDSATSVTGFLNARARSNGTIDQQIQAVNDQVRRMEERIAQHERRLRAQFTRLEQVSAGFQTQNTALSGLTSSFRQF